MTTSKRGYNASFIELNATDEVRAGAGHVENITKENRCLFIPISVFNADIAAANGKRIVRAKPSTQA